MKRRERYGYICLVIMSILGAVIAVTLSLRQIDANNHRFCELVSISDQNPPTKENTGRPSQRADAMFNAYNKFGRQLGCGL